MGGEIDLHSHTTASDGALAPRDLVQLAWRHGVRVLAVTDHDSTDGLAEAQAAANECAGLTLVAGLEINCDVNGGEVHVLGYGVDHAAAWFQDFLRAQRAERAARIHRLVAKLAELGMPIDAADVFAIVKEGSPGRPHVAQVMVARGYAKSVRDAFDRYLHTGGPAHVPRHSLAPVEAIEIIRKAKGVPVLAHPGVGGKDELIEGLIAAGLMGIECYYAEHSAGQLAAYLELCRRHDLIATGGSDFHGPHTGRLNPPGTPAVPSTAWALLQERMAHARAA
jgi:predicted metal-dependent phosphoesterase TrpH